MSKKKIKKKIPKKTVNKPAKKKPKKNLRNKSNPKQIQIPVLPNNIQGLVEWFDKECKTIRVRMLPYDNKENYKKALVAARTLIKLQKIKTEMESGGIESDKELRITIKQYKE